MALTDFNHRIVLYEGPGAEPLSGEERTQLLTALLERGFTVTRAGSERPVAPADRTPVVALGRFNAGTPPNEDQLRWESFTDEPAVAVADRLSSQRTQQLGAEPKA